MKLGKLFPLVAMVLVFILSACSAVAARAQFVQLPDPLKADITAVVVFVVSMAIAKLILLIPYLKFLDEFSVPLGMAIASQLIGLIERATPDAYGNVVILALQLVLAVLALFLAGEKLKAKGYKFS